ncbi:MAG TPA: HEAT repeat domain-containing protein [Gemmataceae bacterium]|nr:HEAT repeat domain-containing protein [Gemmataceae bacterium]
MLDATGKKLLRLLDPDSPAEVRRAAAVVLGELGLRDPEVSRAVCDGLADPDAAVRSLLLTVAGQLRVEPALPQLLKKIEEGGEESELAALAAAKLGAKGTKALQDLMHKVAPGLRRRIAGALAAAGTASAGNAAMDALLDKDPGVVDAAARALSAEIPSMPDAAKRLLGDHLLGLLEGMGKTPLPPASELAAVRLLAALAEPRAETWFWDRIQPGHPVEVRAAALQGLGKSAAAPVKDRLKRLLACAADGDFRVAAPALMILRGVAVSDRQLPDWLSLFEAGDVAGRRLALEKLGDRDTAEVAAALLRQLRHADRALRDDALTHLARLGAGRTALAEALLAAESPDAAWTLARTQEPFVGSYDAPLRERLFAQASDYHEAGDRRAEALLHLLRVADAPGLRDRLEERAAALRKKKQYDRALVYLRLLTRDPACGAAIRLEAAACALKVSGRDLSAEARAADPTLQQFTRLIDNHEAETLEFVTKAKWLEPEELFYLGFHFAEKERAEKKFGGEMLRLVAKGSPKSKLAKDAKSKLRGEGLE